MVVAVARKGRGSTYCCIDGKLWGPLFWWNDFDDAIFAALFSYALNVLEGVFPLLYRRSERWCFRQAKLPFTPRFLVVIVRSFLLDR